MNSDTRNGGGTPLRALARSGVVAMLVLWTAGCATKRDIRDLRSDLRGLTARQDSIFELLQSQNAAIIDSLAQTTEELLRVRGDISHQLGQLEQGVVQLRELTGQVQLRMNRFSEELDARIRQLAAASDAALDGVDADAGPESGEDAAPGDAVEYYRIGMEQLQRGNSGTARRAFEVVVQEHPDHDRAPDAQAQIGETYYREGAYGDAIEALERVVELYPNVDRAPMALYRAGVIAQERGNIEQARAYFERVIAAYPRSDARGPAEEALRRLGG